MNRREPPFVGRVAADGFVIEVGLIGEDEARRRVLAAWTAGSAVREVDQNRWLLTLPCPAVVRCEVAPGLPLEGATGGLAPAGAQRTPAAGILALPDGGRWTEHVVTDLRLLEPGTWIDLDALVVHELRPVERPPSAAARIEPPAAPAAADLRAKAKIGQRSAKADELARDFARPHRAPAARRGGRAAPHAGRGTLARLLLRSPAAPVIRRKHARYLRSLTEAFERKDFGDALRDAIPLGGSGGFTTLRLPQRRGPITGPTAGGRRGGGAIPWGPTIHQHLSRIYREASAQLEKSGRIEEAAFVLADLMGNAVGAVAMLERHGRFALAAEVADGRKLAADLVVRLRWRAGHRQRAIEVARGRGAYAAAIQRLEPLDADQARLLRAAWARDLSLSGDHLAAVEAAWPDRELRPSAVPDIQAGMALGGPGAAHLLAYLLAYRANGDSRAAAAALLRTRDPQLGPARDRFLGALSGLRCSDPAIDRHLATEAARAMLRPESAPAWDDQTAHRATKALVQRADPVLRADLPSFGRHRKARRQPGATLHVDAPENPGQLPVLDACALAGGALLVAHGNHGARLLTLDGRTRAQWDIPTHRLVVADHGGTALLATDIGDQAWELRTLSLVTRRVSPWLTIRVNHFEPSYDGITLIVADENGAINFLDAQSGNAQVLWRELADVGSAVTVSRSPGLLSAIVRMFPRPGLPEGRFERWHWELPGITLRSRSPVTWPGTQAAITSSGIFLRLDPGGGTGSTRMLTAHTRGSAQPPQRVDATGPVQLVTSGLLHAIVHGDEDHTWVDVTAPSPGPANISIRFPGQAQPQIRAHADTVAAWDDSGRIVAADTATGQLISSLRTRI